MRKRLQKIICLNIIILMTFGCLPALAAESVIKVQYNGQLLSFDTPPVIKDGRTLVAVSPIAQAMGAQVNWDNSTQTVTLNLGSKNIRLIIGESTAYINDQPKQLDVPAQIIGARTMVPLSFISTGFGASVTWDETTRTAKITNSVSDGTVILPYSTTPNYTGSFCSIDKNSQLTKTPIYVPSYQNNTNVIETLDGIDGWKIDQTQRIFEHEAHVNIAKALADLSLEEPDYAKGAGYAVFAGALISIENNVETAAVQVDFQKDASSAKRAIVQLGDVDKTTFLRKYAGEKMTISANDSLYEYFQLPKDKNYSFLLSIDPKHKDDIFVCYLSVSEESQLYYTLKLYPEDELRLKYDDGSSSGNLLIGSITAPVNQNVSASVSEVLKPYFMGGNNIVVPEPANPYGNSQGNLLNEGFVCQNGDWIYYSNLADNGGLYRMKTDGSGKMKLSDEHAVDINFADGWVYWRDMSYIGGTIYRIRTDGTDKQQLSKESEDSWINVSRDWLYYRHYGDNPGWNIYRMHSDGRDAQPVGSDVVVKLVIVDDWIYYCKQFSDPLRPTLEFSTIYRMHLDGSSRQQITKDQTDVFQVVGDWVYYSSMSENSKLYRIKTDGSGREKVSDQSRIRVINILGEWVYFTMGDGFRAQRLYRMKLDGSNLQPLSSDQGVTGVNVINDWIFYIVDEGTQETVQLDYYSMYRIHPDGSGREFLGQWKEVW